MPQLEWKYPQDATTAEDRIKVLRKGLESSFDYWSKRQDMMSARLDSEQIANVTSELGDLALKLHLEALRLPRAPPKKLCPLLPQPPEPLSQVNKVRENWEKSIAEEVFVLAKDTSQPLFQPVNTEEIKAKCRFLYDRNDLLLALSHIPASNQTTRSVKGQWGMIRVRVASPTEHGLEHMYRELGSFPQVEIDLMRKNEDAKQLLRSCSVRKAKLYCRSGCPVNVRPKLWTAATQSFVTETHRFQFQELVQQSETTFYITDALYRMDVSFTMNDPSYFPFEDTLMSVMLAFSRDESVRQYADYKVHQLVETKERVIIPPSGVQPFHGLVMYAAPLCYLFDATEQIYCTFREMYARYWCRLNVIRSHDGTLLHLCAIFEHLAQRHVPEAFLILNQHNLPPLQLVFPWIHSAFSGFLPVDQVLILWDRVIGYDSVEILAVFAAALFIYRADTLLSICSFGQEAVRRVLKENSEIQVVPILKQFLFPVS